MTDSQEAQCSALLVTSHYEVPVESMKNEAQVKAKPTMNPTAPPDMRCPSVSAFLIASVLYRTSCDREDK